MELNIKDIEKKMFECVRKETMKANKDKFGIDWVQ
jgi:hypothetical protein